MWPTYKPISWDKYYAHSFQDKHTSITSGLAAGITIGVFFTVFLLTFGCRLYSRRAAAVDAERRQSADRRARMHRRPSVSQLFPSQPPPYELAIQMPKPAEWAPPPCVHHAFEPPPSFSELPPTPTPGYCTAPTLPAVALAPSSAKAEEPVSSEDRGPTPKESCSPAALFRTSSAAARLTACATNPVWSSDHDEQAPSTSQSASRRASEPTEPSGFGSGPQDVSHVNTSASSTVLPI